VKRRVVVTGLGAITPIGSGSRGLYDGLRRERSAIDRITRFDAGLFSSRIAAEVRDFDPSGYVDTKRLKRLDRYSQFAVACARMAFEDARLDVGTENRDLIGCYVGSALGGAAFAEEQFKVFATNGIRRVKPALALSVFGGAASCNIAIEYDLRGPNSANSDSCASGTIATGRRSG
jgi:3-oxoacyl-[acyl-carrier-protein] synthase II